MMGQPGRPGTEDLELALKRLKQLQEFKALGENHLPLPFHSYTSPPRFTFTRFFSLLSFMLQSLIILYNKLLIQLFSFLNLFICTCCNLLELFSS